MFHLVEIVVTKNLWSQNADILDFITVAISEADEIQSDILSSACEIFILPTMQKICLLLLHHRITP